MSRANEIYNYNVRLERELANIKTDVNYRVIKRYYEYRMAVGISLARQNKCISTLKLVSKILKKKFEKATKEDIVRTIAEIEKRPFSAWTKRDYKIIIKKFYQWLFDYEDEYPAQVKWIKSKNSSNGLKKSDLLTVSEIKKLVDATPSLRDKALILVIAESGRRIGEILTLRSDDIEFDNLGARILVDGKTGKDYVRIISSSPTLATWLDNHPLRNKKDFPVWVTYGRNTCRQLSYATARTILRECAIRAGLKKRVWFHLFRHTRGTQAAKMLTSPQLCALMGWSQGSKMPSVYVHLAGEDIDEAQAIMNSVRVEKEEESVMNPLICARCDYKNSSVSKFCNRCGMRLDIKSSIELENSSIGKPPQEKIFQSSPIIKNEEHHSRGRCVR